MTSKTPKSPLAPKNVASAVSTGGAGALFQARVASLYLGNLLTSLPTTLGLNDGRVTSLRLEARYTGANTDDICCTLEGAGGRWQQFIQCKLTLDAIASDKEFEDSIFAAWRDFLGKGPFEASRDFLVVATAAPASSSVLAAKRICELSRASTDLVDLQLKLSTQGLLKAQHQRTWGALVEVSRKALGSDYDESKLFELVRCLRIDIHDLATDATQEATLVRALLSATKPDNSAGDLVWSGLVTYCLEQGQQVGTLTLATWKDTAAAELQAAVADLGTRENETGNALRQMAARSRMQLELISTALPSGVHLPRGALATQLLEALDGHQVVVAVGGPGVGKSSAVASVAPLLSESAPLYFFRADELDQSSLSASLSVSGLSNGLLALSVSLAAYPNTVIVIDSVEKALEFQRRGAFEELLALVRRAPSAKLLVTARSYASNPLCVNFFHPFSFALVDVPLLDDAELEAALEKSGLSDAERNDVKLREVLRTPLYLRLVSTYRDRATLLGTGTTSDIRLKLWSEHVAPSIDVGTGLSQRRRAVFDEVCFHRTGRYSQFVEAPSDTDAVTALLNDGVLVRDTVGRVAPGHDVFEDWSLFFRVEREVRLAERDWAALFERLGTHAGLRRAFRTWVAERTAEGDAEASSLLKYCVSKTTNAPPIWRDEALIGILRSASGEAVLARHEAELFDDDFQLLKRLTHLLRVACKGPKRSVDAVSPAEDTQLLKEIRLRQAMTSPTGSGWLSVVQLVSRNIARMPESAWPWVASLIEDALGDEWKWYRATDLSRAAFSIADLYASTHTEQWYSRSSLDKRFFAILLNTCGANVPRIKEVVATLIASHEATTDRRDFAAEERLKFLTSFEHSKELAFFAPELLIQVVESLYVGRIPDKHPFHSHSNLHKEEDFGLSELAESGFSPESVMQGPFRQLLGYSFAKGVAFIIRLMNAAAASYAMSPRNSVVILSAELSPNGRPHLHSWEFWFAYRGLSVTSYLLSSALMALEERLLLYTDSGYGTDADLSGALEWILVNGESSFTTAVVASVLVAKPAVVTPNLLKLFNAPHFFLVDKARLPQESPGMAMFGLHRGLDRYRAEERWASSKLPHRRQDIEHLVLRLQFERSDLNDAIHEIFDGHPSDLGDDGDSSTWRIARKRMDLRCLRVGPVVSRTEEATYRRLEIADLEPELAQMSAVAQVASQRANRRAGLQLWAAAVLGTSSDQGYRNHYADGDAAFLELQWVLSNQTPEEATIFKDTEIEVAAAICSADDAKTSSSFAWAKERLVQEASVECSAEAKFMQRRQRTMLGQALVVLLSHAPSDEVLWQVALNILFDDDREVRAEIADEMERTLWPVAPTLAKRMCFGLAEYARLIGEALLWPYPRRQDALRGAAKSAADSIRDLRVEALPAGTVPPAPCLNPMDWLIAVQAVPVDEPWQMRSSVLVKLAQQARAQEVGKPLKRRSRNEETHKFELKDLRGIAAALARVLLVEADNPSSAALACLIDCLTDAPEFSASVLDQALQADDRTGFKSAPQLWKLWDLGMAACFDDKGLRTESRRYESNLEPLLEVLLLASIPWKDGTHRLKFLEARPDFVSTSLARVGDTYKGFHWCAQLADGVARDFSVPHVLVVLRDAISRAPTDLFADDNTRWHVETIGRLAVHEHRSTVLSDARLRRATLDVLDALVDAGSSLAFQLRDYLATSPAPVAA